MKTLKNIDLYFLGTLRAILDCKWKDVESGN